MILKGASSRKQRHLHALLSKPLKKDGAVPVCEVCCFISPLLVYFLTWRIGGRRSRGRRQQPRQQRRRRRASVRPRRRAGKVGRCAPSGEEEEEEAAAEEEDARLATALTRCGCAVRIAAAHGEPEGLPPLAERSWSA